MADEPTRKWWIAALRCASGRDLSMNNRRRARIFLDTVARSPRWAARAAVTLYRYTFSPLVGMHCRHLPTCSGYADEAIGRFGLWAGGWITLARLCRCHPLGTRGLDFVPEALSPRARWYLPWRYGRWRGTNSGVSEA
jgi:uncharacterized protein